MRAYKVTLIIVDTDNLGGQGIKDEIECVNYPNDCISPQVVEIQAYDIGEWDDDHEMNSTKPSLESLERYPKVDEEYD